MTSWAHHGNQEAVKCKGRLTCGDLVNRASTSSRSLFLGGKWHMHPAGITCGAPSAGTSALSSPASASSPKAHVPRVGPRCPTCRSRRPPANSWTRTSPCLPAIGEGSPLPAHRLQQAFVPHPPLKPMPGRSCKAEVANLQNPTPETTGWLLRFSKILLLGACYLGARGVRASCTGPACWEPLARPRARPVRILFAEQNIWILQTNGDGSKPSKPSKQPNSH